MLYTLYDFDIDYIYKKLIKFISIFYKLGCKLNCEVLKMLYFLFIHIYYMELNYMQTLLSRH